MRQISSRAALLFALLCASLSGQSPHAPGGPTKLLVRMPLTAMDGDRQYDPCARRFRIEENGALQLLASCSPDTRPASIAFLVDVSASMRPYADLVRETMRACLALSSKEYEHLLLLSGGRLQRVESPPDFPGTLADLLSFVEPRGRTSIVDHVQATSIELAKARGPRRILLVFSDGFDHLSKSSADEVTKALHRARVTLFSLDMFGPNHLFPETSRHSSTLKRLAERTGGLNFPVRDSKESIRAATAISDAIHGTSLISYYSSNPSLDGSYRKIKIELDKERGRPPLRLNYRQGYYAPNQ